MLIRYLKLLITISPLLLSGCYCLSGGRQQVKFYSSAEIEKTITLYERQGIVPEQPSIAEFYAFRSATKAYYKPQFAYSHMLAAIAAEAIVEGDGMQKLEGAPFLVATPFAFVADIAIYPVNFIKSLLVSKADVNFALCDLQKARTLGYSEREMVVEYYIRPSPTIDSRINIGGTCLETSGINPSPNNSFKADVPVGPRP